MTGPRWWVCDGCGSRFAIAPEAPCPRCGEPLAPTEAPPRCAEPERVVAPLIDRSEARRRLQLHGAAVSFPCAGLVSDATAARLALVFLPRWLVDLDAVGSFRLEAGFDQQVRSTVERFELGRWTTREVTETRAHWEPRAGTLARRYADLEVPATTDAAVEAFLGVGLPSSPVGPGFERGEPLVVAAPDRTAEEQLPEALAALRARVATDCATATGAARVRGLELDVDGRRAHFGWALIPVWTTFYRDEEGRRHLLLVHGVTGAARGARLASPTAAAAWSRTASLVAVALGVTGALVGLFGLVLWVLLPVSAVCLIGALAAGARSLLVPHAVRTWNRAELQGERWPS